MPSVGIRELKAQASEIVRRVREEGAVYEVTVRGEVAAHLVPTDKPRPASREEIEVLIQNIEVLAEEIGRMSPDAKDSAEIMRDERRSL